MSNIQAIGVPKRERVKCCKNSLKKNDWKILKFVEWRKPRDLKRPANFKHDKQKTNKQKNYAQTPYIKLMKAKDKKLLKAAREKWCITYRGRMILIAVNFSSEAWEARRKWTFKKCWKKVSVNLALYIQQKLFFRSKDILR